MVNVTGNSTNLYIVEDKKSLLMVFNEGVLQKSSWVINDDIEKLKGIFTFKKYDSLEEVIKGISNGFIK